MKTVSTFRNRPCTNIRGISCMQFHTIYGCMEMQIIGEKRKIKQNKLEHYLASNIYFLMYINLLRKIWQFLASMIIIWANVVWESQDVAIYFFSTIDTVWQALSGTRVQSVAIFNSISVRAFDRIQMLFTRFQQKAKPWIHIIIIQWCVMYSISIFSYFSSYARNKCTLSICFLLQFFSILPVAYNMTHCMS